MQNLIDQIKKIAAELKTVGGANYTNLHIKSEELVDIAKQLEGSNVPQVQEIVKDYEPEKYEVEPQVDVAKIEMPDYSYGKDEEKFNA